MSIFILRFILFSGLLYLSYLLLFSKKSFFGINRAILLLIPLFSLLIPALGPLFTSPLAAEPAISYLLPEVNISGTIYNQPISNARAFKFWWGIYITGATFVLSLLVVGLVKAWRILKTSSHVFDNVHFSENASGPFAFFSEIVIPADLAGSSQLTSVLAHEKAHVDQKHALDNLYYNIMSALFWFNPFIHLLQAELRQTHECMADEQALSQSDPENYSRLLLGTVFGSEISFDLSNRFFNSSLIKTRITMIYKAKTKPVMKGLYLLLIPIITIMSVVSCQKTEQEKATEIKSADLGLMEADQPPLFENCNSETSKEEMINCFQSGVMTFVAENFKYPETARQTGLEGRIYVHFNVRENGETEVVGFTSKFEDQDADAQAMTDAQNFAVDLISSMPKLKPAMKDGKAVAIRMTLPIMMKLE